ncbi:hypothetical protein FACS189485_14580 [Spirochaetia bacterium]|nr:hypothetical protein FACS189485_14580 [Spirochaetia bacterium]
MKCKYPYFKVFLCLAGALSLGFLGCSSTSPAETAPSPAYEDNIWAFLGGEDTGQTQELFLGQYDVHAVDSWGRTPLHIAAENGNADLASFFISLGAEVNALDYDNRTPLGISAEWLDADVAKVLVEAGANIHAPIEGGTTPARVGIEAKGEFLDAILSHDSVESLDSQGRTILHLAALVGDAAAVDQILKINRPIGVRDKDGSSALDLVLTRPDSRSHAEAAERLVLAGAFSDKPLFAYFSPAVLSSNYNLRTADGGTVLHFAAREGYTGFISFLIEKKADVNLKNASGTTPLHEAARSGNIQAMYLLLSQGAEVNAQDAKGNSVLHVGIPPGTHREAIALFLSHGANPNLRDEHGDSSLHIVITLNRNTEILQTLLEGGADTSIRNLQGKIPLYLAIEENRTALVPLLIRYQSDVFAADNAGITPFEKALREKSPALPSLITAETVQLSDSAGNTMLHIAVKNNADVNTLGLILDQKAPVNARNKEGDTSLHLAVLQNDRDAGELLLSRGADIFAPNARGESPLYLAFYAAGGIREWMFTPSTLTVQDGLGNTVLHYAAQWNLSGHIPFLIEQKANTEAVNAAGETPLFVAVKYNANPAIRALIISGVSLNSRDTLGNSALHAAVRWNVRNAAVILIDAGIDINAHALNGKTPLHDAVRLGIVDIEPLIIRAGADIEARDNEGNTPFMEAVMAGYSGTVERLADLGAEPTVRNNRGDTPLHVAVSMDRSDLVNMLLGWGGAIHAKNAQGRTPFQIALSLSPRMVAILLTKDRINAADDDGATPLHMAIQEKAPLNTVKIIVDQGARLSAVDSAGRSPLRLAVDQGEWELAKLLADAGSDPFSAAGDRKTPGEITLTKGQAAIQAVFSGKAINARDSSGNTVLHYAARLGSTQTVIQLLGLGADRTIRNTTAESPADIAARWNQMEIAALLY